MSKTLTLIIATLKSFIRNWTSIFILIIMPLILITLLFFSFNPNGIQKIPMGIISEYNEFDMKKYESTYFSYLKITEYEHLDECTTNIKMHKEYLCMNVHGTNPVIVDISYDNTQNAVIWEILERVKSSIDYIQKEKSKEQVSDFLIKFSAALNKLDSLNQQIGATNNQIDGHISNIDTTIIKLSSAKEDLGLTISEMDQDIFYLKNLKNNLRSNKEQMLGSSVFYVNQYETVLIQNGLPYDTNSKNNLYIYNNNIEQGFSEIDSRLLKYESGSNKGKQYLNNIDSNILDLRNVKNQLWLHKEYLQKSKKDISTVQSDFNSINNLDADKLVNPVILYNTPAYIPNITKAEENVTTDDIVKGINLISLQTIFPTLLFLIVLFLSLLVANFIALNNINSPASQRIKLIKNIYIFNMLSTYLSSLIIVFIPIFCVLLMGSLLFKLNIFINILNVFIILFLVASIFIMLGILLAEIIRKESITLLTTTFLLIFFIFLSGFILPSEKMSSTVGAISDTFPGKIGLNAFNKIIFYSLETAQITHEIFLLLIWLAIMSVAAMLVKRYKQ